MPGIGGIHSLENYPDKKSLETGQVIAANEDGTFLVRARSGWQANATPVTPAKAIGLGFEKGDRALLFTDYDGAVYMFGYIPAVDDSDRSIAHPLQKQVRKESRDVMISTDQDVDKSGILALSGSVLNIKSSPTSQEVSTPSGNKKAVIHELYKMTTNAGDIDFDVEENGVVSSVTLSGRANALSALASKVRMDKSGITISFDTLKQVPGAREDVSGPTSQIKIDNLGNVEIEAVGLASFKAGLAMTLQASTVIDIIARIVTLAGGGPQVSRVGDLVDPDSGIIITGSLKTFSG